ncbi:MAG: hypothetical protein ACRDTF_03025 [Pseudonocardiaceae bacterium]
MTSGFFDLDDRIQAAKAELGQAIEQARRDLARFRRENQPTDEERQALQDVALRGELGDDMRELARRVARGQDTWEAIFSGGSPSAGLLRGHLDRMTAQNRAAISTAIEEDPDFDPFPPDETL